MRPSLPAVDHHAVCSWWRSAVVRWAMRHNGEDATSRQRWKWAVTKMSKVVAKSRVGVGGKIQ
jgi:hypothetical protein